MNYVARNSLLKKVFKALPIVTGLATTFAWGIIGQSAWTFPGIIAGSILTWRLLDSKGRSTLRAGIFLGYAFVCISGFFALMEVQRFEAVAAIQFLWGTSFLVSMISLPILDSATGRAQEKDLNVKREKQRLEQIAKVRSAEMEHAQRINRQRKWADTASGPGYVTGFEPKNLENIDLVSHPLMHGTPGLGLDASGFGQQQVQLGKIGEVNFARALQSQGILARFASFWSVQMPDEKIGASTKFNTDIDCVLISKNSLWLVDVKNYVQGSVSWRREMHKDEKDGRVRPHIIAVDDHTGGYVGRPRAMSENMKMATERLMNRLSRAGINFQVVPIVVMMPRNDGLGKLVDVQWPENIPAVGLPEFLSRFSHEGSFDSRQPDSEILVGMMSSLLKGTDGSALGLGQRPESTKNTRPSANHLPKKHSRGSGPSVATNSGDAVVPSRDQLTSNTQAENKPEAAKKCAECSAEVQVDAGFCFDCGAPF
ncbi:NERD domain-containing protein [Arthrobacter sp. NIO-1057]|uniref:NERD domain-containing protein n=1 Tax=Arthrobacter sp. NIO-1057 TaxID=993071 RepID=UPI00071E56FB|nr:NERD domain-containing protein [Arthrobacter sp. NIO-1057]KSU67222.1 hypothetical protein AS038_05520 [Arthrobacter sp. NIO-1057]SCC01078.1 Nuclease-related domain-containing protein [Arthrobacter sp. NIO-1057]